MESDSSEISQPEAHAIVDKRLRQLDLFSTPGMPEDLRQSYLQARQITAGCHSFCESLLLSLTTSGSGLPLGQDQLYVAASAYLDHVENTTSSCDPSIRLARRALCHAITKRIRAGGVSAWSIREIIERDFSSIDSTERLALSAAGAPLAAQKDLTENTIRLLLAVLLLARLWRLMFYRSIDRSSLVDEVARREGIEALQHALVTALAGVPMLGHFVEAAVTIFRLVTALVDREGELERMAGKLSEMHELTRSYVVDYLDFTLRWSESAEKIQIAILDMHSKVWELTQGLRTSGSGEP